jgi:hypothetical protein
MTSSAVYFMTSCRLAAMMLMAAVLLVSGVAQAAGVPVYEASKAQLAAAQKKFEEGSRLYDNGEFERAIELFRESHEIVASPNTSLMIARSYRDAGNMSAAHAAYQAALSEAEVAASQAKKYKSALSAVQKELKELEMVVAQITLRLGDIPADTEISIDGNPVAADALQRPVMVAPGVFKVVAKAPSGEEVVKEVSAAAGESVVVDLSFGRESPPVAEPAEIDPFAEPDTPQKDSGTTESGGGGRAFAYIAGGVGIAGLATFGVFGALSRSKFDKLEDNCTDDRCHPNLEDDIDKGKAFQTAANVGLVVGIVGVVSGTVLFLVTSPSESKEQPTAKNSKLDVGLGLGSIAVTGRF